MTPARTRPHRTTIEDLLGDRDPARRLTELARAPLKLRMAKARARARRL